MCDFEVNHELQTYDAAINVIGGLRESALIFKTIEAFFDPEDSIDKLIDERNEFGLRSESSRKRIKRALEQSFLSFKNDWHSDLIFESFKSGMPSRDKELLVFWQFALSNRLFREVSINVFAKNYFAGRASLGKDDIIAFLKELFSKQENSHLKWSESTISTLATKYLNLMVKLDLLVAGTTKKYKTLKPSSEAQVMFLYMAKAFEPNQSDILKSELLPLLFVSSEDLKERLKKLSLRGYFHMNYNGVALNIELTHSNKEVCDALYN